MTTRRALTDQVFVTFGRYAGWALRAVYERDKGYVRWLDSQRDIWLESRFPEIAAGVDALLNDHKRRRPDSDKRPSAAPPRRASAVTSRVGERRAETSGKTTKPRCRDSNHDEEDELIAVNARFLSQYLTGNTVSLGVCYAFLKINMIANRHDVDLEERVGALTDLAALADYDDELVIEVSRVLKDHDHGFPVVPKVSDIARDLMVARDIETEVDDLFKSQPRNKIILRRPGSLVGRRCRVRMEEDGWQVGKVLADGYGELEIALDNGGRAVGPRDDPGFELVG
jgi:hypothetical protein